MVPFRQHASHRLSVRWLLYIKVYQQWCAEHNAHAKRERWYWQYNSSPKIVSEWHRSFTKGAGRPDRLDYVLKPEYKHPKLSEVKSYIDKNRYLPDVPSGKELEKTGVDVTEMLKLQMKKIEELTLYLIEQDKKNKALEHKVADLSRRLQNNISKTTK